MCWAFSFEESIHIALVSVFSLHLDEHGRHAKKIFVFFSQTGGKKAATKTCVKRPVATKWATWGGIARLDVLPLLSIMQLLRDNLTLWTEDMQEGDGTKVEEAD